MCNQINCKPSLIEFVHMDKLKVFEETQISPPPSSVPPTSLPCTYFDLECLGRPPVQLLFFYQSPQPKTILPNLKHSLSLTLQHYYPLAGNLKWPQGFAKPELVYNDGDSVALTVAESECDFDELSSDTQEVNALTPLSARFRDSNCSSEKLAPLLAIQITFFGDKGICIGITLNQVVADGKTIFSFVKAWASIYSSGTSAVDDSLLPFYDRSSIIEGLGKKEALLLNLLKENNVGRETFHNSINAQLVVPKGVVQAVFTMSFNRIQRLKHLISASITKGTQLVTPSLHLSSFSVTCAYIWVCLIKAGWSQMGESSPDTTEHLLLPVDARERMNSPVPLTYFGNCIVTLEVKAKRSELLGKQGIVIAALLIGKGIQGIDVCGELEKDASYDLSLPPQHVLGIGCFPGMGAYRTDFGWGKPKRFQMTLLDIDIIYNIVSLNDCPNDEGGIEIGLVCNTKDLNAFASTFANSLGSHGKL